MACSEISIDDLNTPCTPGPDPEINQIILENGYQFRSGGIVQKDEKGNWVIECDFLVHHDLTDVHPHINEEHGRTLDFIIRGESLRFKQNILGNEGKTITLATSSGEPVYSFPDCFFAWCDYKKVFVHGIKGRQVFDHSAFIIRFQSNG
jgi:hypothetical protein